MNKFVKIIRELRTCSEFKSYKTENRSVLLNFNFISSEQTRKLADTLCGNIDSVVRYDIDYNGSQYDIDGGERELILTMYETNRVIFLNVNDLIEHSTHLKFGSKPEVSYPYYLCDCDKMCYDMSDKGLDNITTIFYNKLYDKLQDENVEINEKQRINKEKRTILIDLIHDR